MRIPAWIFCLAAAGALASPAWGQVRGGAPPANVAATRPADGPAPLDAGPLDDEPVPITLPALVDQKGRRRPEVRIPEGTTILDRTAALRRSAGGKWWTVADDRVGRLYLLPCRLLEAVEKAHAEDPKAEFRLSGEVYRYGQTYYLMLRQAEVASGRSASTPAATKPPPKPRPTKPASTAPAGGAKPKPATAPGGKWASPEDVARAMLAERPGTPVVPVAPSRQAKPPVGSVPPAGKPLGAGPEGTVVNRLARLIPRRGTGWFLIAFESDNTLGEPPMRGLPNQHLHRMVTWSDRGTAPGAVFHVSGEVHRYKGSDYLLLWNVIRKRNMDQF